MKYTLTKEGVATWNNNSKISVGEDTTFHAEFLANNMVAVQMCDIEHPLIIVEANDVIPVPIVEEPKQRKPLLIAECGGVYLNKETQNQIDNIDSMLQQLLDKSGA